MNPFTWLCSAASALFRRARLDGDLDQELRTHLQDRANDLQRCGVPRTEAERLARLEFGGYQSR